MKKIMLVAVAMIAVLLLCTMTAIADDDDLVADHGDSFFIEAETVAENRGYEIVAYIHDHNREYVQTMSHRERIRLINWLFRGRPR